MRMRRYLLDVPLKDYLIFKSNGKSVVTERHTGFDGEEITPEILIARRNAVRDNWDSRTERERRGAPESEEEYEIPRYSIDIRYL